MPTLLIDNYDSYTYNLFQLLAEVTGEEPLVVRNDQASWADLGSLDVDSIVISPGPGSPDKTSDFGVCHEALIGAEVPVLGVCLGHQGLGLAFGGAVVRAPEPMHGRRSEIFHDGSELFRGIPQGISVVRYHSLIVDRPVPPALEMCAWTADGLVMGLRHRTRPLWGVQFHPESIATEYGRQLIENFAQLSRERRSSRGVRRGKPLVELATSLEPVGTQQTATDRSSGLEVVFRRLPRAFDPEAVFASLFSRQTDAFWLDSNFPDRGLCRFAFMGDAAGPRAEVVRYQADTQTLTVRTAAGTCVVKESIFSYIDARLADWRAAVHDLPFDFVGGFVGYFGYELKSECGGRARYRSPFPDATFILADRFIALDQQDDATYLVAVAAGDGDAGVEAWFAETAAALEAARRPAREGPGSPIDYPVLFELARGRSRYLKDIEACKAKLFAGESYEICLTNQLSTAEEAPAFELYRTLRQVNPAPYSAYLRFGDVAILSSSPERFLKIDCDRWMEAKPIKGTRRRGKTDEEDLRLREDLRSSEKDRAENLMIVDLLRNDLGIVSDVGSVHVPRLMEVESYATVHQLVSTVRGKLRTDLTAIDAIRAAFPPGSMTGAPKIRTMEIIDELEGRARGIYSGALGYVSLNGAADLCVVIRTIVSEPAGLSMGIGGAIIVQSEPDDEFEEILLKARAPVRSVVLTTRGSGGAHRITNATVGDERSTLAALGLSGQEEATTMTTLAGLRDSLDAIDAKILDKLGQRLALCCEIARHKKENDIAMLQLDRVGLVTRRYEDRGEALGFDRDAMRQLATLIIAESCRIEEAIIGPVVAPPREPVHAAAVER